MDEDDQLPDHDEDLSALQGELVAVDDEDVGVGDRSNDSAGARNGEFTSIGGREHAGESALGVVEPSDRDHQRHGRTHDASLGARVADGSGRRTRSWVRRIRSSP